MTQTVKSLTVPPGQQILLIEKPRALCRIFIRISALLPLTADYRSKISFDDPMFYTFFILLGPVIHFEAKGEGIFQGNIWVRNESTVSIIYTATEILV